MNKKVLVLERGAMTDTSLRTLVDAGFTITFIHGIDGIRQIGDVPLRDYFAAAALQGVLAGRYSWPTDKRAKEIACLSCYELADAMLAEREKGVK